MRTYEVLYIVRPEVPEEELDRLIAQFEGVITSAGGTVKTDKWGRRRLAYAVKRCREGQYVLFTLECDPPAVRELERRLKVADAVVKFLTVRTDLTMKRLAKIRKKREEKAKRKKPAAAAPPAPAPYTPAEAVAAEAER
jgi:small subunit ribosomal protein S6